MSRASVLRSPACARPASCASVRGVVALSSLLRGHRYKEACAKPPQQQGQQEEDGEPQRPRQRQQQQGARRPPQRRQRSAEASGDGGAATAAPAADGRREPGRTNAAAAPADMARRAAAVVARRRARRAGAGSESEADFAGSAGSAGRSDTGHGTADPSSVIFVPFDLDSTVRVRRCGAAFVPMLTEGHPAARAAFRVLDALMLRAD